MMGTYPAEQNFLCGGLFLCSSQAQEGSTYGLRHPGLYKRPPFRGWQALK